MDGSPAPSGQSTPRRDISLLIVKDKVVQSNIKLEHCPANALFPEDRMWANVLTKPKSGRPYLEDCKVQAEDFKIHL